MFRHILTAKIGLSIGRDIMEIIHEINVSSISQSKFLPKKMLHALTQFTIMIIE